MKRESVCGRGSMKERDANGCFIGGVLEGRISIVMGIHIIGYGYRDITIDTETREAHTNGTSCSGPPIKYAGTKKTPISASLFLPR